MTTKKDIRKHFLELRLNLDDVAAVALNAQLERNARQLDYSGIRKAHIFLPISEKKEVDTWPLVKALRTEWPEMEWVLSRSDMKTGEMIHILWKPNTVLVKNKFGIPEPDQGEEVPPADIDLVFVPLLAFDHQGHRVGYGKGMYDRFLKACRPDIRTIGLSLFGPVPQIEDTDPWDIPLQTVVSPDQIYQFK
ncbi:5-formyltetrahydrofolate cyclo-ligase [Chitinophaga arvensicola]|uniref:5-formyltetrahydrofolate cyclo-ligase n=1 Tax=Chitinophaga arvensicola TaxID=29529 RepID=A0A1I0S5F8_9BACT|nr:5-formyltetrahydrofolate cyclo-ligase [Chitinophaga arvensicola]SEW50217.1 5-formyltetrahydrofolate cyclo-ligase [Chitinophaga arvensicola]